MNKSTMIPVMTTATTFSLTNNLGINALSRIYSHILEEDITNDQTRHLVHVQVAFIAILFSAGFGIAPLALTLLWFATSLLNCRKAFCKPQA